MHFCVDSRASEWSLFWAPHPDQLFQRRARRHVWRSYRHLSAHLPPLLNHLPANTENNTNHCKHQHIRFWSLAFHWSGSKCSFLLRKFQMFSAMTSSIYFSLPLRFTLSVSAIYLGTHIEPLEQRNKFLVVQWECESCEDHQICGVRMRKSGCWQATRKWSRRRQHLSRTITSSLPIPTKSFSERKKEHPQPTALQCLSHCKFTLSEQQPWTNNRSDKSLRSWWTGEKVNLQTEQCHKVPGLWNSTQKPGAVIENGWLVDRIDFARGTGDLESVTIKWNHKSSQHKWSHPQRIQREPNQSVWNCYSAFIFRSHYPPKIYSFLYSKGRQNFSCYEFMTLPFSVQVLTDLILRE